MGQKFTDVFSAKLIMNRVDSGDWRDVVSEWHAASLDEDVEPALADSVDD